MRSIYKTILLKREVNHKMLAVLLDPDQCHGGVLASTIAELKSNTPDFIFVGGSHTLNSIDSLIDLLKDEVKTNIILFPGNASQFSPNADALLYLSLLSGRNAEFLIGQHVGSAVAIKKSDIEVIPTGYLLIDGGKLTSVEYISNTRPIPYDKPDIAVATAIAGELLGLKLIYLDAGSGAEKPVPEKMIKQVKQNLKIPLIVGGGIRTIEHVKKACENGADIIIVGNIIEQDPGHISKFCEIVHHWE